MTKIVRNSPICIRVLLVCIWIETGNPRQPLACRWIAGNLSDVNRPLEVEAQPSAYSLCA